MKIKLIANLLLCFVTFNAFSQVTHPIALKTVGHVTPAQEQLLADAFGYLNQFWSDQGKSISREITEKYFDPDTTLIINGKTVYRGYAQFESHFKAVGKSIRGQIKFPLLEIISVNDQLVVRFDEDVTDNSGKQYPSNVLAIFTLRNGKIWQWDEVVNSPYFCQSASQAIVYSK
jgi:ketosteroid isomerase-like protein